MSSLSVYDRFDDRADGCALNRNRSVQHNWHNCKECLDLFAKELYAI